MKKHTIVLLLAAALLFTGCFGGGEANPTVAFASPTSGATINVGESVDIAVTSAEASGDGIARIEVFINGALLKTEASPSGSEPAFNVIVPWVPNAPGGYNVMAVAYAADSTASSPATLILNAEASDDPGSEGSTGNAEDPDATATNDAGGSAAGANGPVCGNGVCEETADGLGEDCLTCPSDCGACCGNGVCEEVLGENVTTCSADCANICGNGICEETADGLGEDCLTCPDDCGACCGNGVCEEVLGENVTNCSADCQLQVLEWCGDGLCNAEENGLSCPQDCTIQQIYCGDGTCNGDESCFTCTEDCGPCVIAAECGNGVCEAGETLLSCPADCGLVIVDICGDGLCTGLETFLTCPDDCPLILVTIAP